MMRRVQLTKTGKVHLVGFYGNYDAAGNPLWELDCQPKLVPWQGAAEGPVTCKECLNQFAFHQRVERWIVAGEPEGGP